MQSNTTSEVPRTKAVFLVWHKETLINLNLRSSKVYDNLRENSLDAEIHSDYSVDASTWLGGGGGAVQGAGLAKSLG